MIQEISFIYILTKARHDKAYLLGTKIKSWLQGRGISVSLQRNEETPDSLSLSPPLPDLIFVLGGDGTILSIARKLGNRQIPLLGLNLGQVGFLTELSPENWETGLECILRHEFVLSPRIMLEYKVTRNKKLLHNGKVVNDLVVGRGGMARLIELCLWEHNEEIADFRADGVIISTPAGSTAYAVAAGGSLISPELSVLEICPICPFPNKMRPIILSSHSSVHLQVKSPSKDVFLTVDGQYGSRLQAGDIIHIQEAQEKLLFVQLLQGNYIKKLKGKGYL